MNISAFWLVWSFITGGGAKVTDYLLGLVNAAVSELDDPTREKIQAFLNFTAKVLAVLRAVQVFVPVRWQSAYLSTVGSVEDLRGALSDLELTGEEYVKVVGSFRESYRLWCGPDDQTCVSYEDL